MITVSYTLFFTVIVSYFLQVVPTVSATIIVNRVESLHPWLFLKLYCTLLAPILALLGTNLLLSMLAPLNTPPCGSADKETEEPVDKSRELKLDEVAVSLVQPVYKVVISCWVSARL